MKKYDELVKLVGIWTNLPTDSTMVQKVAEHCRELALNMQVFGRVSLQKVDKYLKAHLDVGASDISFYLSETESPILLFPNNSIEDTAEELEDFHFPTLKLLTCASSYNEDFGVLWVDVQRQEFGTIEEADIVEMYFDEFAEWALAENTYTPFDGGEADRSALFWIKNNKNRVVDIVNDYLN